MPTVMEFEVFSSPLPEVAADAVLQLVSGFSFDVVVVCATEAPAINDAARIAAAKRKITISSRKNPEIERRIGAMVPLIST